jgi:hypothetical protein
MNGTIKSIEEFIKCIDFPQLKEQKKALTEAIITLEKTKNPVDLTVATHLNGILHFIDGFQDLIVDAYGVDENTVYHFENEEE